MKETTGSTSAAHCLRLYGTLSISPSPSHLDGLLKWSTRLSRPELKGGVSMNQEEKGEESG